MNEPLRVLIVEDSADDAELILYELKRGGYELFASRVETAVAMKEALDNGQWGVVLSDFSMPNFNGQDALELLRAKGQDIPFIIVSGKIGEETAVAMMKAGAHDYIMKDNLKRLFPAVQRELQEAGIRRERRRADAALKESEERYRSVVENTGDLIQSVQPDGHFLFVNKAWLNTLGYSAEELPGLTIFDIIHPDSLSHCREIFERVMNGEMGLNIEATFVTKNGEKVFVIGNASPRYIDGKVVATQGVFHDITERKRAEEALKESEAKYSTIVEKGNDGIVIIQNSLLEFVNLRIAKMAGFSREEILGKPFIDFIAPADRKQVIDRYQNRLRRENVPNNYEINIIAKNGKLIPVEINPNRIIYKRHAAVMAIIRDITERKKMEENLRRAAQEWRTTFDSISDMVSIQDRDNKITRVNRTFANVFKKEPQELIGKICYEVVHGMGEPISGYHHLEVLKTKKPVTVEINNAKDDTYSEIVISPIFNADGEVAATVQIIRNITDRKHAEEEVKKQYAILKSIIESPRTPIFSVDRNYRYTSFNSSHAAMMKALYGADIEIGKNLLEYHSVTYDRERAKENIDLALKGELVRIESWAGPEGTARTYFEISHSPVEDDNGNVTGVSVFAGDLTERKRMEDELKASEAKYRTMVENLPVGIAINTFDGRPVERNRASMEMHGYTSAEEYGKVPPVALYTNPEDRNRLLEALDSGPVRNFETIQKRKDGSTFWVSMTGVRQVGENGENQMLVVSQDIDEKKRAEEALKESEENFRSLVENAPIGIGVNTQDRVTVTRNIALMKMCGYDSKEEFMKANVDELYYDVADRERFWGMIRKGPVKDFEVRRKRRDGSIFWTSQSSIINSNKTGKQQVIILAQDITERKRAEGNLERAAREWRTTFDSISDPISIQDKDYKITRVNKAYADLFRMKPAEVIGKTCFELVHHTKKPIAVCPQRNTLETRKPSSVEVFDAGSGKYSEISTSPIFDDSGNVSGTVHIMKDITGRKQSEEAIRASEEKFRNLVENAPVGISITAMDGKALFRNQAVAEMYSFNDIKEMMANSGTARYYNPEDRKRFFGLVGKGIVKNFEVQLKRKDGTSFWASFNAIPITTPSGEKQFINIAEDITARKEAEVALRASEERYRSLVENLPVGIGVATNDGRSVQRNRALMEIYGYTDRQEFNASSTPGRYYDIKDRARFVELAEKGPVKDFEVKFKRRDGTIFWALMNSIEQTTPSGEKQFISVIQDIDEKKKTEEENQLKATLLDSAGDMILLHDLTGKIIYANDAACKTHGYNRDEMVQINVRNLLISDRRENYSSRALETLKIGGLRFETEHICKDGTIVPLEVYNSIVKLEDEFAIISIERDITERRKMEEQLIITDRLASIGELASGVAHEVNNPLTSVIGFSELLLERPLPDDIKEDLTTIHAEAQRAAGVVRNLLTFARKHPPSKQPVNLNGIIQKVLELRAYEESVNNIRVITRFAPELLPVMADASQLQQVFFNIVTNAEYFMIEAHHKGTFTITTENIDNIVRASFADDGPGMSADNLAHLFTPFFTTKPVGKGTGLGLSICHGIITSHEGKIYAESTPGKGATFIVELPVSGL